MSNDRKIIPILQTTQAPDLQPVGPDPHVKLSEIFLSIPRTESRKQKNLTAVEIGTPNVTRKNRVALVVMPEWTTVSPPLGMARMSALAKHMGFATRCWDINVMTRRQGPDQYWSAYLDWQWQDPYYSEVIHPQIAPIMQRYLDEVVEWAPTVVGFSCWYTNDTATKWAMKQIRERLPGVKIVVGGPNATQLKLTDASLADHVVSGEGELWWVRLLENFETPTEELPHICVHDKSTRIDLDSMPPADYADIDISLYDSKGITSEFSRGCIANCVYCNETVFWKYRARMATTVLDEIELAYRTKGITSVYFIDSLVNGNLRELQAFAHGLIDKQIRINWTGYARIDGKMDRDFWRDLKMAGATGFAFGIESGSQKVLDLMKKNCRVENIVQNFEDMAAVDMYANFATWFVGFPGEEHTDVAQTMTLMWNLRETGMGGLSCGSCGLGVNTPLDLERERFGINSKEWCWAWTTNDLSNTAFHRFIRFKTVNILLEHFRAYHTPNHRYTPYRVYPNLREHYTLEYNPGYWQRKIPWEKDFDYDIVKIDTDNPVQQSLINEIWPFLRVTWLSMGPFRFSMILDPERDLADFGYLRYPRGNSYYIKGHYNFEIDESGNWQIEIDFELCGEAWQGQETSFHSQIRQSGQWQRPRGLT